MAQPHPATRYQYRALDVGCAVGRASFELAREFHNVVGIDFSHAFVGAANQMKADGRCGYTATVEGDVRESFIAYAPPSVDRSRVVFEQGDACNLRCASIPPSRLHELPCTPCPLSQRHALPRDAVSAAQSTAKVCAPESCPTSVAHAAV